MEELENYIEELEKLKSNLKKSKNRVYEQRYVDSKLERLTLIQENINRKITEDQKEEETKIKNTIAELLKELTKLIENLEVKKDTDIHSKMASFDISLVGKNLQTFKGTFAFLDDFLTQTELLHDLIKTEDRQLFIKYVYNFKLTTQVRSILGRSNKPTTFAELKKGLESAYPNPKTLQQVLSELGTTKQHNNSISEFREKVAELSDQLSSFEISNLNNPSQEARDIIYKVSDSLALNTFMRGVNNEYQQILLSNVPKSFNEAVERCVTAEKSFCPEDKPIYQMNKKNNRNNNRSNNNYRGDNYSRNNDEYTGNNYNKHDRNNNNQRNNYRNYNNNGNNYRNHNRNVSYNNGNYIPNDKRANNNSGENNARNNFNGNKTYNRNSNSYNNNNMRNNNNRGKPTYRTYHYDGDDEPENQSYDYDRGHSPGNFNGRVTEEVTQSAQN